MLIVWGVALLVTELVAVLAGMGERITFAVSLIPFFLLASFLVVCMLGAGVVTSVVSVAHVFVSLDAVLVVTPAAAVVAVFILGVVPVGAMIVVLM